VPDVYTTGSWEPFPGSVGAFQEAWADFAAWATGFPGAGRAVLGRDLREEGWYVSFIRWESDEAMRAWKASPDFKPRMGRVQRHIDKFSPTEIVLVAESEGGATSVAPGDDPA
jgi:heme-degrading monooxygenase HmoA